MKGLARAVVVGNLTADPDTFSAGCRFSVAVNERIKRGDDWVDYVSYFDITVFGKQADNVVQYLSKGSGVAVDGRLRHDRWQNDQGEKRSAVKLIADNVTFLPSGERRDGGGERFTPEASPQPDPVSVPADDPEDIPF